MREKGKLRERLSFRKEQYEGQAQRNSKSRAKAGHTGLPVCEFVTVLKGELKKNKMERKLYE